MSMKRGLLQTDSSGSPRRMNRASALHARARRRCFLIFARGLSSTKVLLGVVRQEEEEEAPLLIEHSLASIRENRGVSASSRYLMS